MKGAQVLAKVLECITDDSASCPRGNKHLNELRMV